METHDKVRALIRALREHQLTVLIPYPVLVETAAVIARLAGRELTAKVMESLRSTRNYVVVYEEEYQDRAL